MKRLITYCLALTIFAGVLVLPTVVYAESPEDILIIVNKGVPINSITRNELKDYYLKKRLDWRGGDRAVPVHSKGKSELRKEFCERVLNLTLSDEESYWRDKKIRTGVTKPAEFSNTLKAVFKIGGAVSYVYRSQYREGVAKVVLVIPAQ